MKTINYVLAQPLNDLLRSLTSDEARASAITQLFNKHKITTMQAASAKILFYREGKFVAAARVAIALGLYHDAVTMYAKAHLYGPAGRAALQGGMFELAMEYFQVALCYKEAAEAALRNGEYERAISFYEKEDLPARAAGVAFDHHLPDERFLYLCEKAGWFPKAAKIAKKMGLAEKLASLQALNKLIVE